ncbi:proton-coupled zinc antiporter SLC30A2 isoform X1 [Anastrepha obliqua]|uniref:proton-coupled zinc antiporter SLC30A2 isoform X1 n=1 Tax=Anastrepha obliqua TaxID=95512 RepID=UPI0024092206|nr:proton-coupled zinc antiporter SLC30A2 isoform X1 [Anastrepha obliqua]
MSKKEATPFVIDFKSSGPSRYGAADASCNVPTSSRNTTTDTNPSNNNNNASRIELSTPSTMYVLHGRRNIELRDHCHRQRTEGVDIRARKKLIIASVLCLVFMVCEIIGGILSNSLAIATDAAHLLTDFASFMISLFAIWIAGRPSTQRMSFGWYRAEVIGAMASVIMIWVITAILVWLAVQRLINRDFEVDAKIMLITSGLAILVNLVMGLQLQHGHSHGGMSGAHGHSHGGKSKQKSNKITNLQVANDSSNGNLAFTTAIEKPVADDTIKYVPGPTCSPTGHCALPATQRPLEDGAGELELDANDAVLPASGLATFSYQNSTSVKEVHAEIAAVMAETAPAGHHHGGAAARDAENLNVRAAFIHVVGDMIQSAGVFVAALVIFFRPDWAIIDPICTFFFSIIVLFTTFSIMKDALLVLMEGTPSYMHYAEVLEVFQHIEGVRRVHNLRIWALSINKVALSVHLAIAPGANAKRILEEASTAVHRRYNFFETTIQIEEFTPQMENCQQCCVPNL